MTNDATLTKLREARSEFLALVDHIRPDLHRYCARMTGSIIDGEDIVQDTLARAYEELSDLRELPALRAWLFRIAHNRAVDFLRRYDRRMGEPLDTVLDIADNDALDPEDALGREEAVHAAISRFLELAPAQRSCVILKDVLDHSLEEIAAMLGITIPATKAALYRGRTRLRGTQAVALSRPAISPAMARYAALFNARDWDGVRRMLIEDVRLEIVSRSKREGRREVAQYFTNYSRLDDWHLIPARVDGREVLAVLRGPRGACPAYVIELSWIGDRVAAIRDFNHVPYIAREGEFELPEDAAYDAAGIPVAFP